MTGKPASTAAESAASGAGEARLPAPPSAELQGRRDKRFAYVVTAVDGDLSVLPKNLTVGTILLEKRGRGRFTQWDFVNMETGAFAYAAGRKIGVGYAVNGKIEWVGGTPPEAQP